MDKQGLSLDLTPLKDGKLAFMYFCCKDCTSVLFEEDDLLSIMIVNEEMSKFHFIFDVQLDFS